MTSVSCSIERLESDSGREWDRFVQSHPESSVFHLFGWRTVVERSFGYKAHYLAARREGSLVGILPLFQVRTLRMRRALISLPFAIRGGPIGQDLEVVDALIREAEVLAESLKVDYLELRSESLQTDRMERGDAYVTFQADLTLSREELLKNMVRKRRQMMNYVEKAGFVVRIAGIEEVDEFYRLFCQSMRSHGTPVYPKRFVHEIMAAFPSVAAFYFVSHEGRTVAGVLNLQFRDVLMPFYAGTDRERRLRGLDDFTYWSMMQWGRDNGYRIFDFGRSRVGTGAYKFKARWGMEEIPLAYHYKAVRASSVPHIRPDNPRLQSLIRFWQRIPIPLTRVLGPIVVKRLP